MRELQQRASRRPSEVALLWSVADFNRRARFSDTGEYAARGRHLFERFAEVVQRDHAPGVGHGSAPDACPLARERAAQ